MKFLQSFTVCLLFALPAYAKPPVNEDGVISWRYQDQLLNNIPQSAKPSLAKSPAPLANAGEKNQGFVYLNELRTGAGLIPFAWDNALETAAQNHADYLVLNYTFGHSEVQGNNGFTGVTPSNRGDAAGYTPWTSYGENISAGDNTVNDSIDGLISAIYHRFGFLTLSHNDIGIGIKKDVSYVYGSVYNYNSGNLGSVADTRLLNPKTVRWPYANYDKAQTSFNNTESPDPLPECPSYGIAGNPVSIEFNPAKNNAVTMNTFKLFAADGSEITNTKVLTEATDPASTINANQFVLFPLVSLSVDSKYRAEFNYNESGATKNLSWNFRTKRYDIKRYEVTNGNTYDVISGQTYLIHIKTNDCTTALTSYGWSGNATLERLNVDLFRISVTSDTTFTFGSSSQFTFILHAGTTDNAIDPSVDEVPAVLVPIVDLILN